MIPRRQGFSDINATIPVGDGQLPPLPEPLGVPTVVAQPAQPKNNASKVIDALLVFSKISKKDAVDADTFDILVGKKLVVTQDDYAVISEKGLRYIVDFTL